MTQPPDPRDPIDPTDRPSDLPGGDAPTESWQAPADRDPAEPGWAALTPESTDPAALRPEAAAPPPPPPAAAEPFDSIQASSPLISAEPAAGGPAVSWTPPSTGVAPREVAPGLVWADTPSRFVAYVIDGFLVGIVSSIISSILGFDTVATTVPGQPMNVMVTDPGLSIVTVLVGAVYFILSWSGGRRATLGQRLFKIQVGNAFDGVALTTEQAVKRWLALGSILGLLAFLPSALGGASFLQFVWAIVLLVTTVSSPTKQGIHDKFANSAVVRPAGAGNGLAVTCLILIVAIFGLAIVGIVLFAAALTPEILSQFGESI